MRTNTSYLCFSTALLALAAFELGLRTAPAAVTEGWVHRYNNVVNNSSDHAAKVVRDASGDIIVTGTSEFNLLTIKYSGADGSVLWQRLSEGAANNDVFIFPTALAVDPNGNVAVAGYSPRPGGGADYYTATYASADGALLWEKRYNNGAQNWDYAIAVAMDRTGNAVVTGVSRNAANSDYYTAKYAVSDGALVWESATTVRRTATTSLRHWRWTPTAARW